jgi:hypothetical protein
MDIGYRATIPLRTPPPRLQGCAAGVRVQRTRLLYRHQRLATGEAANHSELSNLDEVATAATKAADSSGSRRTEVESCVEPWRH